MKVEVYTEVLATKPHPQGGEQYDEKGQPTWSLIDSLTSLEPGIIAAFLHGLADEFDPRPVANMQTRTAITLSSNVRVSLSDDRRDQPVAEIISKKPRVLASMLRGTAENLTNTKVSHGHVYRGPYDREE